MSFKDLADKLMALFDKRIKSTSGEMEKLMEDAPDRCSPTCQCRQCRLVDCQKAMSALSASRDFDHVHKRSRELLTEMVAILDEELALCGGSDDLQAERDSVAKSLRELEDVKDNHQRMKRSNARITFAATPRSPAESSGPHLCPG